MVYRRAGSVRPRSRTSRLQEAPRSRGLGNGHDNEATQNGCQHQGDSQNMNSGAGILARIPLFKLYRKFGWPQILPLNLTLSPSPRCNSRCLTCNIWMKRENELTLDEWDKVLRSLGTAPYWFTVSGGEPFMFQGVVELCQMAYQHCQPGIINIPTNAILPTIPDKVRRIAESCPKSQLIINLSLDGLGEKHDLIRGVAGNFERFEHTLHALL